MKFDTLRALAMATALIIGSGAQAADEQWPPAGVSFYGDTGTPDISGLWLGTVTGIPGVAAAPNRGPADGRPETFWAPWPLPYTAAFKKAADERAAAEKAGVALNDTTARCAPFGLPRMLVSKFYPDEIVQTPGQVTIFVNSTVPVMIFTDGRGHPKDIAPSFNGHSIGYWIGDTLYVDTVGLNGLASLDSQRHPVSDKLHLRWSIRRISDDLLHVNITIYDAGAFTEPVTTTNLWQRKREPNWQVLDDASCFENNSKMSDEKPEEGFMKF